MSSKVFDISFARAGSTMYPPGGRYGPRIQPCLEFCLIYSGHADIYIDGEKCFVPSRHIAILRPGMHEDFYFSKEVETKQGWVHIELNGADSHMHDMLASLPFSIPLSNSMDKLTEVLQSITCGSTDDGTKQTNSELRCTLASSIISLFQLESQTVRIEQSKHPSIIQTKRIIHDHYAESWNLQELAIMSGVSREYLIRLFRKEEGVTPMRYLWKIRVNHALELLQNTGLSLEEITERTGFQSVYHLSRMIKSVTGQTSTAIRQAGLERNYIKR